MEENKTLVSCTYQMKRALVIQIDGGGSQNKGAELMLHAVLSAIQQTVPDAEVILNCRTDKLQFMQHYYGLKMRLRRSEWKQDIIKRFHLVRLSSIVSPSMSNYFTRYSPRHGVDVVFNIGGYQFGDQWHHTTAQVNMWKNYLSVLAHNGTKIIFLPQAFGPFEAITSQQIAEILHQYADILIARDEISFENLRNVGVPSGKLWLYPDFTASVKPEHTIYSEQFSGRVCFIPNYKMITSGRQCHSDYVHSFCRLIDVALSTGHEVFLLNHEGARDEALCREISEASGTPVPVCSGLNGLQTKAVISNSYLVVSSRYHGVASALNSGVPCLSTSWSHKYQTLLKGFGQEHAVVDLEDMNEATRKLEDLLTSPANQQVRKELMEKNRALQMHIESMWNAIWNFVSSVA
ncbi:MAG: polysaccharide pyruvyl transferase family protein [Prevotella sp.]|nr:polysaccharide pyruvyl transferase family protein [Prevotella sp.]